MNISNVKVAVCFLIATLFYTQAGAQEVPQIHRDLHNKLQNTQEESLAFMSLMDSLTSEQQEEPFDLFPALDLYGTWNDDFVNPFAGQKDVVIPDSAVIYLNGYYPPIIGKINSHYGWRRRRMHRGTDLKLAKGDTVRAAFDGQVRIKKFNRRGYGYYYVIRHSNGLETVYGHLSKFIVDKDDYVRAGQPIGLGGSTGRSSGPHLHFEMRFMGIDLNPETIIDFEGTHMPIKNPYIFVKKKAKNVSDGGTPDGKAQYHIVKQGDTLGAIARKYRTSVSQLCKLNKIKQTSILRIGQRIRYR